AGHKSDHITRRVNPAVICRITPDGFIQRGIEIFHTGKRCTEWSVGGCSRERPDRVSHLMPE
ncbi:hypothetical protein, partial [Klebsiella pneumoniae]|uniref:hypothetical protein n=1 Tax=Klebsiella pneumoniae TaxID=573 RepID=UPI001C3CC174